MWELHYQKLHDHGHHVELIRHCTGRRCDSDRSQGIEPGHLLFKSEQVHHTVRYLQTSETLTHHDRIGKIEERY